MSKKTYLIIFIITILAVLFRLLIFTFLKIDYQVDKLFLLELFSLPQNFSPNVFLIVGIINTCLIFFIGRKFFNNLVGLVLSFLMGLSPWIVYAEIAKSPLIITILGLLLVLLGIGILSKKQFRYAGLVLFLTGLFVMLFSSILVLTFVLIIIWLLYNSRNTKYLVSDSKRLVIWSVGLVLIFVLLCLIRFSSLIPIVKKQVSIFSSVGLINSVNTLQGETADSNFRVFARLVENKYSYLGEHFIFNTLVNLSPGTVFTAQAKMGGFSFSSPIILFFLGPFLLGIPTLLNRFRWKSALMVVIGGILPASLSVVSPDLNRLVLIAPFIFVIIAFGIEKIFLLKKRSWSKVLFSILAILVLVNYLVVISDIIVREPIRQQKYDQP